MGKPLKHEEMNASMSTGWLLPWGSGLKSIPEGSGWKVGLALYGSMVECGCPQEQCDLGWLLLSEHAQLNGFLGKEVVKTVP